VGNEHLAGPHEHRSGFNRSLIVTDPLIKPNEHLAGFLNNDGGFIVGPSKAPDGVQVFEEGQGHKLGLLTDGPSQQPRSPESPNLPQVRHDLGAIVQLIAICLVRARPASPHPCDHDRASSTAIKHRRHQRGRQDAGSARVRASRVRTGLALRAPRPGTLHPDPGPAGRLPGGLPPGHRPRQGRSASLRDGLRPPFAPAAVQSARRDRSPGAGEDLSPPGRQPQGGEQPRPASSHRGNPSAHEPQEGTPWPPTTPSP
jgi:hypothetical protein